MGRGPDDTFDDLGAECGPVSGSARIWREPYIYLGFDLQNRLGSISLDLGALPHARGLKRGDTIDQLRAAEPAVAINGPIPNVGEESGDYYEWTVTTGPVSAQGTLSEAPPAGRVDSTVHLAAANDPTRCGE